MSNPFATPWTVACQTLLSMGFSMQEYWSGWPFPSPGNLSNPGIKSTSSASAGGFFTTEPPGMPKNVTRQTKTTNKKKAPLIFPIAVLTAKEQINVWNVRKEIMSLESP